MPCFWPTVVAENYFLGRKAWHQPPTYSQLTEGLLHTFRTSTQAHLIEPTRLILSYEQTADYYLESSLSLNNLILCYCRIARSKNTTISLYSIPPNRGNSMQLPANESRVNRRIQGELPFYWEQSTLTGWHGPSYISLYPATRATGLVQS